ncbi:MAG: hypothetical protein GJ676_00420 [Rhodobacteraceae bacterium]|nr:hypothetical protein [Paracoccaceae bacterium]
MITIRIKGAMPEVFEGCVCHHWGVRKTSGFDGQITIDRFAHAAGIRPGS